MFRLQASDVIVTLTNTLLDRNACSENGNVVVCDGVSFTVETSLYHIVDYFKGPVRYEQRARMFFVICGDVRVFSAIEPQDDAWNRCDEVPLDQWFNASTNDLLWASEGVEQQLQQLHRKMANKINDHLDHDGHNRIPRGLLEQYTTLGSGAPWRWVRVTCEQDTDPNFWKLAHLDILEEGVVQLEKG